VDRLAAVLLLSELPCISPSSVHYVPAVDAHEKQLIIRALVRMSGSQLESFFRSHGLAGPYRLNQGAGKEQKIKDALAGAERMDRDVDELLRDAVKYLGLADESPAEPPRITGPEPDVGLLTFTRLDRLHPEIKAVSADLYRDGYQGQAIFEAFKRIEVRVKELTGLDLTGRDLMAQAFRGAAHGLMLNEGRTLSDRNEQEGFKLIFMGASQGIRNPKAHDVVAPIDEDRAFEYLAFASLLMRRLDDAD
jgi:uncharacterized protein (TIGR02391 family)